MPALQKLDVNGCKNLKELYINGSALRSLDFGTCSKLYQIDVDSYRLQNLKFARKNSIHKLSIGRNLTYYNTDGAKIEGPKREGKLSTKYFKYLNKIQYLLLYYGDVGNIDFTRMPELRTLNIRSSSMSDMNLSKCSKLWLVELKNFPELKNVQLAKNKKYHSIEMTDLPKVKNLDWKDIGCPGNYWNADRNYGNWGISGDFSSLQKIDVSGSNLTTLIIPEKNQVRSINAQNDKDLKELDLSNAKDLTSLDIRGTGLKEIDVSTCEKLTDANILHDADVKIIRDKSQT